MTAKFYAILTNQGAAMLANAAALGTKLNLTQMAVGDANGALPVPDPAQTKLINQKRIAPLNMLSIDPQNASQIVAEQVIPENEGGFWIREIGLFDDGGVLIAVANCPETYKPQLQEGSGRTQTIRMALIVSSTAAVTLKIDPSVVLATRQYVDEKVIEVKAYADDLMKKHVAAENPHTQYLQSKNNLSEVADKAKARGSLGLGSAALKNTGTSGDAVPLANGANTWSAKQTFSGGAQGALTGNASTATKLQTARKIGGVAFDGSADINLPGVNAAGNQATSGNAGSATKLQTARKIGGASFDGTADISVETLCHNMGLIDSEGYAGRWINTQIFNVSGTYTPTPGVKKIKVTMTGGGGGGGGCQASSNSETYFGAGGGAGGTIISTLKINDSTKYPVVIGAGGKGCVSASNGSNGGTTSFASLLAAPGGVGGGKSGVSNTNGGAGGKPENGDLRINGGFGGDGQSGLVSASGAGGASYFGGGGRAGAGGGVDGQAPGSGGGGAYDSGFTGTKMTGGTGSDGIMIIEEYV